MLLQTFNVSKTFQRRSSQGQSSFDAVSDVCLTLDQGDFVTITGKSGSGKTTLLTLLAGLATPSSGSVRFQGRDMHTLSDKELSALRNHDIGFVPQGSGLLGNLSIYDNIRAPQLFSGNNPVDSSRADYLLEKVGLHALGCEYPASLSGGEMRRASIARALFNEPALLIADEPTGDLDSENTQAVMALLHAVNEQGTAVIVVTHEAEVAVAGSARYVMQEGKLYAA